MRGFILGMLMSGILAGANEYKLVYMDSNGNKLDTTEALLQATKGEEIFKCQTVEYKVSKSGTSIGLKNVKKPKAE